MLVILNITTLNYLWNEKTSKNYSFARVIYFGINATDDPHKTLLSTSDFDETESIPRFAEGSGKAVLEQGRFFNYNQDFARKYISAW